MAITLVTGTTPAASTTNGGDVTLTLPTLQENDVVVVFGGHPFRSGATAAGIQTSGYSTVYSQDASGCSFVVAYKRMGASPDSTVVGLGSGNVADATAYGYFCLRGVDTTTAEDQTRTTSTTTNPASIVTQTNGAWVLALTGTAANDATPGTITNYVNTISAAGNDNVDITIAGATREIAAAGTEDPGAWSTLTSTTPISVTTAWRPTSGTAYSETPTDAEPLSDTREYEQGKAYDEAAALADTRAYDVGLGRDDALALADSSTSDLVLGVLPTDTEPLVEAVALDRELVYAESPSLVDETVITQPSKWSYSASVRAGA